MVYEVNVKEFIQIAKQHYERKIPLMIYGGFGIGKSTVLNKVAQDLAKRKGKTFVDWNRTTAKERNDMFESPEKYFVFIDVRLSQNDNTDLKGLPKFDGTGNAVEWKIPKWIAYLVNEQADGIVFFDEINLAPPSILASAYQILHDRCMGETKLSDNVGFFGAGNRAQDHAHTFDMPAPLKDRMSEIELTFNTEKWFDWAYNNDIDTRIITFLQFKNTLVNKVSTKEGIKSITPRGWERASTLIKGIKDNNLVHSLIASAVGEGVAVEFSAFLKLRESVDLKSIIKEPQSISKYDSPDMRYSIVGGLAEIYKQNNNVFESLVEVCDYLPADFGVLLLKLMSGGNKTKFKTQMMSNEKASSLLEKYFKFFYDGE